MNDFKRADIKSLTPADVIDPSKTHINRCKAWAETNKTQFKKYITYYCNKSGLRNEFRSKFVERINAINRQHGIPAIA